MPTFACTPALPRVAVPMRCALALPATATDNPAATIMTSRLVRMEHLLPFCAGVQVPRVLRLAELQAVRDRACTSLGAHGDEGAMTRTWRRSGAVIDCENQLVAGHSSRIHSLPLLSPTIVRSVKVKPRSNRAFVDQLPHPRGRQRQ